MHHFAMRAYPDLTPDFEGIDQAYELAAIAREHQSNRSNASANIPWVVEGPTNIGGRINEIAVHPTNKYIIYVGAAAGGVFKTTNGGTTWLPITDDFDYLPIGAITLDPNNPDIVYVGTGDPNISGTPHIGNGIFKSTDGGQSWNHLGLVDQRIVAEIIVDPSQSNTVYAATMGNPFERNNDRGLYKSTDGGQSWNQILFLSDQAGVIDLIMHPNNPQILYAAGWDRIRTNQESTLTGPSSRIYQSVDGGQNWSMLTNGLPNTDESRIGIDISLSNPDHLVAVYVGANLELLNIYESFDGGGFWAPIPSISGIEMALSNFGWYFGQIRINPNDDSEYTLLGVDLFTTNNGGQSWYQSAPPWWTYNVHADKHDLVFYGNNSALLATDGGLYRTVNSMSTWTDAENLPITQFYRVAVNPHNPGVYTGGTQDNGTTTGNLASANNWNRDLGGDGFQAIFDPTNANIRYAETQRGNLFSSTNGLNFGSFNTGLDNNDRRNWDMPFVMSHHDPMNLYTGTFRVYRTDMGPFSNWQPISNDLTDGVIFGDGFHNISSLGESPLDPDIIYAGTSDGNVWITLDVGNNWTDVTASLPDRYVTSVEGGYTDEQRFFVTHSGYRYNDFFPHVHRTDDAGANWVDISGDLPPVAINDLCVYPDSGDTALFAATDAGVYYTMDGGQSWHFMGNNMLPVPVFDVEVDTTLNQLVAGTFARSMQTFPLDSLGLKIPIDSTMTPIDTVDTTDTVFSSTRNMLPVHIAWRAFPNPASELVTVEWLHDSPQAGNLLLLDPMGRLVREITAPSDQQNNLQIDVSSLESGTYLLLDQEHKQHLKLLVQH